MTNPDIPMVILLVVAAAYIGVLEWRLFAQHRHIERLLGMTENNFNMLKETDLTVRKLAGGVKSCSSTLDRLIRAQGGLPPDGRNAGAVLPGKDADGNDVIPESTINGLPLWKYKDGQVAEDAFDD